MPVKLSRGATVPAVAGNSCVYRAQKNEEICWAACIEMLLLCVLGQSKDQDQVVEDWFGRPPGACNGGACADYLPPEDLQCVLAFFYLDSVPKVGSLQLQELIDVLPQPVVIRCSDAMGDGHVLLVTEYLGGNCFYVLDPWQEYKTGSVDICYLTTDHARGHWSRTWHSIQRS